MRRGRAHAGRSPVCPFANQSAREVLYTPTSKAEKYQAKAFIDMCVNRFAGWEFERSSAKTEQSGPRSGGMGVDTKVPGSEFA